jgi:DNA-binding transcriptional MerR regulator
LSEKIRDNKNGKEERISRPSKGVSAGFGAGEVQRFTGISRITLHVWDKSGFLRPALSRGGKGTGNRRKYSFADIVALRVIKKLRLEGVSLRALKKVAKYLREREGVENPFAQRVLAVNGSDVVMVSPEEVVSVLKKPGQHYLLLKLDIEDEARRLTEEIRISVA